MARCFNCGETIPGQAGGTCPACRFGTAERATIPADEATCLRDSWETAENPLARHFPAEMSVPPSARMLPRPAGDNPQPLAPSWIRRRADAVVPGLEDLPRRVIGRIIATDRSETEPPDFDLCRALNRLIWLVLIVLAPFILVAVLFLRAGPFTGLLAALAFLFLLRYLTPTNLLALLHLSFLLHPFDRNRDPGVLVRFFRVRDQETGAERMVRMKGRIGGGNLDTDDLATFEGTWRNQVLHARRALNHRTGSVTLIRESLSWLTLSASLVVISVLIILLKEPVGWLVRETAELIRR